MLMMINLYVTGMSMQPESSYGVVNLGLGSFGLISFGIYSRFKLMSNEAT